jgi:hypothetical protein
VLTTGPHTIALAGFAAAADPCGSLNFFPTASQITGVSGASASVAVNDDVTCTGNQVCNWPSVVNRTAQEAYQTELGTSVAAGGLLSVAVKEYSGKQLRVFFRPVSPLLTANANAMSCVLAKTPTATRKLSQASTYAVTTPGSWSYSATLSSGGTLPGGSRAATATGDLTFSTEGAEDVSDGRPLHAPACSTAAGCNADSFIEFLGVLSRCPALAEFCTSAAACQAYVSTQDNSHRHMCSLADKGCCCADLLQDKKYCATINVVLSGYTVSNAPSGFPRQITLPFSVCWYKHNGQASARFNFGSCGAGGGESAGPTWLRRLLISRSGP